MRRGRSAIGLGGYLAAKRILNTTPRNSNANIAETVELPDVEIEVPKVFREYGLSAEQMAPIVGDHRKSETLGGFRRCASNWDSKRRIHVVPGRSAGTIASSSIVEELLLSRRTSSMHQVRPALWVSVGVTLLALFVWLDQRALHGVKPFRGGSQTVLVGGLAAAAVFFIARLIS